MSRTTIQWTDFSINPIRARGTDPVRSGHYCEKVSSGCKHCYSSRMQPRFGLPFFQEQRREPPELFLDAKALVQVLSRKKPTKWFWCDMTDMFGEWVPNEWIAACFGVMAATPWHTHQVLTKRPKRMLEWFQWLTDDGKTPADLKVQRYAYQVVGAKRFPLHRIKKTLLAYPWPLLNVWLGVSIENQKTADERVPLLVETPAAVRFLSCEPLLEELNIFSYLGEQGYESNGPQGWITTDNGVDWVIAGGESGHGARSCNVEWIRSIVQQCKQAGVPAFVKQLGAIPHIGKAGAGWADSSAHGSHWLFDEFNAEGKLIGAYAMYDRSGGEPAEWPADIRVREFPEARR